MESTSNKHILWLYYIYIWMVGCHIWNSWDWIELSWKQHRWSLLYYIVSLDLHNICTVQLCHLPHIFATKDVEIHFLWHSVGWVWFSEFCWVKLPIWQHTILMPYSNRGKLFVLTVISCKFNWFILKMSIFSQRRRRK